VWTGNAKIASIGVHVSRGITSHGFALNVATDLSYFSHIVPCGMPDVTMTSMAALGHEAGMDYVMDAVVQSFATKFEIEMQDGNRAVAPAAWTPAMAL
jgi:lipoyl(octanoyl) transferase